MSLKPSKYSDQKKLQEKMRLTNSKMESMHELPPYTLIISEGIKTEKYYLDGFVNKINEKYKHLLKEPRFIVHGTGRNTRGLLKYVDDRVTSGKWSHYQIIWLVYDKDDFPYDDFDNTQFSVEGRKDKRFRVAWSNECIELWFLLHFQDFISDNGRKQYIEKLNEHIEYSKTREDLYDVISNEGSLKNAKRRAKRLMTEHKRSGITSPSKMVPATRMYQLIEELEGYLTV